MSLFFCFLPSNFPLTIIVALVLPLLCELIKLNENKNKSAPNSIAFSYISELNESMEGSTEVQSSEQRESESRWPEMRRKMDWSWRKVAADSEDGKQAFG